MVSRVGTIVLVMVKHEVMFARPKCGSEPLNITSSLIVNLKLHFVHAVNQCKIQEL